MFWSMILDMMLVCGSQLNILFLLLEYYYYYFSTQHALSYFVTLGEYVMAMLWFVLGVGYCYVLDHMSIDDVGVSIIAGMLWG